VILAAYSNWEEVHDNISSHTCKVLFLTKNLLASTKATPPMLPSGSVKRPRSE
jgi:hypothetical protein